MKGEVSERCCEIIQRSVFRLMLGIIFSVSDALKMSKEMLQVHDV
jgi:hypothetical protein